MVKMGYRQTISFYDKKRDNIFFREIIYPKSISENDIYSYFSESISFKSVLCIGSREECLYQTLESNSINKELTQIEKYWSDGSSYLVEYKKDNKNYHFIFVVGNDIDEYELNDLIKQKVVDSTISFVDKLNDCWIKI